MPQACRRNCVSDTVDLKTLQNDSKTIPHPLRGMPQGFASRPPAQGGLLNWHSTIASFVQKEVACRQACRRNCISDTADLQFIQNDSITIPQSASLRLADSPLWSHVVDPHMGAFIVWCSAAISFAGGEPFLVMQIYKLKYHIDSGNDNNQRKNILQNPGINFIRKICAYNTADNRSRHKPQKQVHVQTSPAAVADCRYHTQRKHRGNNGSKIISRALAAFIGIEPPEHGQQNNPAAGSQKSVYKSCKTPYKCQNSKTHYIIFFYCNFQNYSLFLIIP